MADHTMLVMAEDQPFGGSAKKGVPIVVRPASHVWAREEGLPQFVLIDVPNSARTILDGLIEPWVLEFEYRILAETPTGWRIRIEVDPVQISPSGRGRNEMKPLMETWLASRSSFESRGPDFLMVTLPKLGASMQHALQLDKFKQRFSRRFFTEIEDFRFHFTGPDVDVVRASGGRITLTQDEVTSRIQDKRAV